jgi:hypothetical protein
MDKDGKLKLMPKDEIKLKLGRSPDFADALMMRMWFEFSKDNGPAKVSIYRPTFKINKRY